MSETAPEENPHEWAESLNGKKDSLIQFYNHYLKKAAEDTTVIADDSLRFYSSNNNVLFVIDMQNDFVKSSPEGAFSVADGVEMAPKLLDFININKGNFSKIILSRDTHDKNHCSFFNEDNGGIFPRHCVINTPGSEFYTGFETLGEINTTTPDKVDVIFKGMDPTADSFGAVTYGDPAYYKTRYSGSKCCNKVGATAEDDKKCTDATGGRYLTDKKNNFVKNPFCENCSTHKEIENYFDKEFKLSDVLPTDDGTTNIFVVGLAGDFCCKDTAINLALQAKSQGKNVNVYVIQDFVRYAFLPCQFSGIQTAGSEFKNYVFESTDNGFKILSESEANVLTLEKLKDGFKYNNFLTNPTEIIADYEKYGVRILMNAPIFKAAAAAGGRRTRKNRRSFRRTKKMNKSKKIKTRKMNKSRKRR
jgi:nicotinamidase-related amidase